MPSRGSNLNKEPTEAASRRRRPGCRVQAATGLISSLPALRRSARQASADDSDVAARAKKLALTTSTSRSLTPEAPTCARVAGDNGR